MKAKLLNIMFLGILLTSCASINDLKEKKTCHVWEDQAILGPIYVEVEKELAYWEGRCALMGLFACSWVKTDIDPKTSDIYIDGNGIFNSRIKVAKLQGNKVIYEKTILDRIIKSTPISINMKNRTATRKLESAITGKISNEEVIEFNSSCSAQQAALGSVNIYVAKTKK